MTDATPVSDRLESLSPRTLGVLAGVVGAACLLAYPLAPAEVVPGTPRLPSGAVEASHPFVVYCSVVAGPVLCTWGAFAIRHRTVTPLTPRRAALAPLLSLLAIAAGVARFVSEWVRATPFESRQGDEVTAVDPSLLEIVRLEVTGVQFVALAAASTVIVGALAARYGRRRTIVAASLPVALVALGIVWQARIPTAAELLFAFALVIGPLAVGYLGTRSERRSD